MCNQEQSSIGNHIKKPGCKIQDLQIDRIQFDRQLESFKEGYRLEMNRRRKQKSRAKLLEEKGPEIIKAETNRHKLNSINKKKDEKGPIAAMEELNKQKIKSREKMKAQKGPEIIKAETNEHKIKSRNKM